MLLQEVVEVHGNEVDVADAIGEIYPLTKTNRLGKDFALDLEVVADFRVASLASVNSINEMVN